MKNLFPSILCLILILTAGTPSQAQSLPVNAYIFSNFAGQPGASNNIDGTGSGAQFNTPRGVAVDSSGNLYIADYYNHVIRKVTAAGVVTTLAGKTNTAGSTDGTGGANGTARFDRPNGIAVDAAGNVYVASLDNTIRKVTPAGAVTTIAGSAGINCSLYSCSTDGTGTAARFNSPTGVAVDGSGNLYVADQGNDTIRKITPAGVVTTLAGTAGSTARVVNGVYYIDGTGSVARFYLPTGVAVDGAGNVYVTDYAYHLIRKVTAAGVVTTIAGYIPYGTSGSADGVGTAAYFNHPSGITIDSSGNLYVTDKDNATIRRLAPSGSTWTVATMAGSPGTTGTADGTGSAARFSQPEGIAVDSSGNLYVADTQNHRITKGTPTHLYIAPTITTSTPLPAGTVGAAYSQTLAATGGTPPYTWSLSAGTLPAGLGLSSAGVLAGTLAEVPSAAFTVQVTGADGASATKVFTINAPPQFTAASPLPSGAVGTAYSQAVTASGGTTPYTWAVTAGTLPAGLSLNASTGYLYGTPTTAGKAELTVQVTGANSLSAAKVFSLTITPVFTTPAELPAGTVGAAYSVTLAASSGSATATYTWAVVSGSLPDGWSLSSGGVLTGTPGAETTFSFTAQATDPNGIAITKTFSLAIVPAAPTITSSSPLASGTVGVAYSRTLAVYGGTTPYTWSVVAGSLPSGLSLTGSGLLAGTPDGETAAHFTVQVRSGNGLTATRAFRLAVTVPPATAAGYCFSNFVGLAGTAGSTDGTGSEARLNFPGDLTLDGAGNLFFSDTGNQTIRKVTPAGIVTTLAGLAGNAGSADGTATAARFSTPNGIVLDGSGNLYVADTVNHTIRRITAEGGVTTLAGSPGASGRTDGAGSEARFYYPYGLALDSAGNLFVADGQYSTIRRVTPQGAVTTFAGDSSSAGKADGTGTAAKFYFPTGLAFDSAGVLYVADEGNNTIRKVTPTAVVTTLAGLAGNPGSADGTGTAARFNYPRGVAVDPLGNLFVTDSFNHTIRKVTPTAVVTTLAGLAGTSGSSDGTGSEARFYNPTGIAVDGEGVLYVADARNHRISKGAPLLPQPTVTTANPLPDAPTGQAYGVVLTARGGTAPYTWSVVSGSLPAGLGLASDGVLSGTPTAATTAEFTVQVADSTAGTVQTTTKVFHLTVDAALTVTTASLPAAAIGIPYRLTLTAAGGTGYHSWSLAAGSLPAGLTLSNDGTLAGTPTAQAATDEIAIQVTDVEGFSAVKIYSLAVNPPPTVATPALLPRGFVGSVYQVALTAAGGTAPFAWDLASGGLPAGLTLAGDGTLAGTLTARGTTGFTLRVTDGNGLTATQASSLTVRLRGDINDDGRTDLADAVLALQLTSGLAPAQAPVADAAADGSGTIGPAETVYVLQKAAGLR